MDEKGGVVLLARNATNGGTDNCGYGMLCGGTPSRCKTMPMVRFDDSGSMEWQQQVTNLSDTLAGYDNGACFTALNKSFHHFLNYCFHIIRRDTIIFTECFHFSHPAWTFKITKAV